MTQLQRQDSNLHRDELTARCPAVGRRWNEKVRATLATAPNERQESRLDCWRQVLFWFSRNKKPCASSAAPAQGVEPQLLGSEPSVLPLDDAGMTAYFVRSEGIEPSPTG